MEKDHQAKKAKMAADLAEFEAKQAKEKRNKEEKHAAEVDTKAYHLSQLIWFSSHLVV
jgi:hypothetical protein